MEADSTARKPTISRQEWGLILFLSAIQFTNVLDFMIIMPLGPQLMSELQIGPNGFSWLVGMYGFGAVLGSLLAAPLLDRFDRKSALILLYACFTLATFACGLATSFATLMLARTAAGAFGGVVTTGTMAIIGDVFADYRRGTATGAVMSAFAVASIMGVPAGLGIAQLYDWNATFLFLAALCVPALVLGWWNLPSLRGHLNANRVRSLDMYKKVFGNANHARAYVFSAALVMGSFAVVPYIATYMVMNVGMDQHQVFWVYLVGGVCTLVTMNVVGRMADRHGKLFVFRITAGLSVIMTLVLTNLPAVPTVVGVGVCALFMISTSARIVPAQAMITASSDPALRGPFLSINTSLQHLANGLASVLSGQLLDESGGKLTGYTAAGILGAICALTSIYLAGRLRSAEKPQPAPVAAAPAARIADIQPSEQPVPVVADGILVESKS